MIIHNIIGNKNIDGFIKNASLKSKVISSKKALPKPHPGQGNPPINLNGQDTILNKCVIQTYKKNSIIGKLYFLINLKNNLIYCFIKFILVF